MLYEVDYWGFEFAWSAILFPILNGSVRESYTC